MARISANASRMASTVVSDCTLACSTNGPGAAPELEGRAGAVGVALVLAQVHVDPADELPAEDHVEHERRMIVGRRRAATRRVRSAARTARPRSMHEREPARRRRGGGERRGIRRSVDAGRAPRHSKRPVRGVRQRLVRRVADGDQRRPLRAERARGGNRGCRERSAPAATPSVPIGRWP